MQQSSRDIARGSEGGRFVRSSRAARVLVAVLLLLSLGSRTWEFAVGTRCARSTAGLAVGAGAPQPPAVDGEHSHSQGSDDVAAVPANGCPLQGDVVRAATSERGTAGDCAAPRSWDSRLATATDPPSLFRPPRSA